VPTKRQSLLLLDLPSVYLSEFSAFIDLDRESVLAIAEQLNEAERDLRGPTYVQHYSRSEARHEISAHFSRGSSRSSQVTGLHVLYDLSPTDYEEPRDFRSLVTKLAPLDLRVQVRCDATFLFPKTQWTSVFTLPWKVFEGDANVPFDEVRGLRVAKHANGQVLWSGIVDLQGETYMVNARYTSAGILNEGIFAETLTRGIEIAGRVVKSTGEQ